MLKKLLMLAAMLALVVAVGVARALASDRDHLDRFEDRFGDVFFDLFGDRVDNLEDPAGVSQEIGNESQSGDVSMGFSVMSTGDNSNQCVTPLQFGNTGRNQYAQGFLQYASTSDDVEFDGSSFVFAPSLSASCNQAVQQSSAAS